MGDEVICPECGQRVNPHVPGTRHAPCSGASTTRATADRETKAGRPGHLGPWDGADTTTHPSDLPTGEFRSDIPATEPGVETIEQIGEGGPTTPLATLTFSPGQGPHRAEVARDRPADGVRMGGYLLIRELGRGGMGVVYAALQLGLNRQVAIKRIRRGALAAEADLLRFKGEAEVIATLDHPNIVPIYEIGEEDGEHYFCMKLFEGRDLRSRLADFRNKPDSIARLVATIAGAVQYAHQRGILHRDLKPSNILLDSEDQPHLIDFGLALRVEESEEADPMGIVGTPSFMAPEQASGTRAVTTLSDVYGLGGILYSLLTGCPPFEAETTRDLLRTVIEKEPVPRRSGPKGSTTTSRSSA